MLFFESSGAEKKTLKILFWCLAPIFFAVFFRLYGLVFGLIYGGLISLILGPRFTAAIMVASTLTAIVFTALTCRYIYRQFKKHIIVEI